MFYFFGKYVKICKEERCGYMSYYFSSDGSLKYTAKTVSSILDSAKHSSSSSSSSASSSGSSSKSSFSNEMKNAAQAASGKITSSMKDAARANNQDFQRFSALQAKIQKIASHKPRTFNDDDSFTFNTSAINNYTAAQEKYKSYKKKQSS